MLREFGGGVAAPSANRFGRVSPTTAAHVRDDFGDALDFVLDGGACAVGVESTIAPGDVRAPGTLASHYAPRAEVVLVEPGGTEARARALRAAGRRVAVLSLGSGDEEAARVLYAEMRRADAEGADAIVVSLPPESGLGLAIADRLRKAAAPR
jgi:L-threonylcarbamoyladenylate synthase